MATEKDRVFQLLTKHPLISSNAFTAAGIERKTIKRMTDSGEIVRLSRGLYCSNDYIPGTNHSIIEAQKIVKQGVICLFSALSFHEIGSQNPSLVWMAIPNRAWNPLASHAPIQIVRFSDKAYTAGITEYTIENERIKIYCIAKTIADCFKYRNKIGLDVAIEALRDVLQNKKATVDEILHFAEICRVKNIMKPYMESMI